MWLMTTLLVVSVIACFDLICDLVVVFDLVVVGLLLTLLVGFVFSG